MWVEGLGVALGLLALAALVHSPTIETVYMGQAYEALSVSPFDPGSAVPRTERQRLLAPLMAWAVGLRGERYLFYPLIMALGLLAVCWAFLRREQVPRATAAGVLAIVATSAPILWTLSYPGYVDTTTYFFLAVALFVGQGRWLWTLPLALACLSHEGAAFSIPFFVALPLVKGRSLGAKQWGLRVLLGAASVVPVLIVRRVLTEQLGLGDSVPGADQVGWIVLGVLPLIHVAVGAAFGLGWLLLVGSLMVTVGTERRSLGMLAGTLLGGLALQQLFGGDTYRFAAPAFMLLLLSGGVLHRALGAARARRLVLVLAALHVLGPHLVVSPQGVLVGRSLPLAWALSQDGDHDFMVPKLYQSTESKGLRTKQGTRRGGQRRQGPRGSPLP